MRDLKPYFSREPGISGFNWIFKCSRINRSYLYRITYFHKSFDYFKLINNC